MRSNLFVSSHGTQGYLFLYVCFSFVVCCLCDYQNTCHKVAALKQAEGKKQWIAIIYDETVRKSWSNRAYSNDTTLQIEKEADAVNQVLLEHTLVKYDSIEKAFSCIIVVIIKVFMHYSCAPSCVFLRLHLSVGRRNKVEKA